jgi:hypothetical protein
MTLELKKLEVKQGTTKVYNFSVEDYHTYFVTDLQIWTHNTSVCPIGSRNYKGRFEKDLGRKPYPGHELHHGYPQKYEDKFKAQEVDIHAPENIYELPEPLHRTVKVDGEKYRTGVHSAPAVTSWNGKWDSFFVAKPNATKEEMVKFRDKLGSEFAIDPYLGGVK